MQKSKIFNSAVLIASLGYFVDIFDLLLFSIVRKPSLVSLGVPEADQVTTGLMLHNTQMIGMLIGGVLWGMMADRRGRLSVLFGSIFLYSVANLANAFVDTIPAYAVWRFLAGLGLAGELGAGITLVAESLPKHSRGYGTMIVATVGVSGAVVAGLLGEFFDWRVSYMIGGLLGVALLILRVSTAESLLFQQAQSHEAGRGNFLQIFKTRERGLRFLNCILIGIPIWFVIGTLIQLAPEFAKELGVQGPVTAGRAVMFCYGGLVFGDFASGALSQLLKTRLKVVRGFQLGVGFATLLYFFGARGEEVGFFYGVCFTLGFFTGYWAVLVTIAAEQFGTNLRGTVATSVPNFVRASVVPMSLALTGLKGSQGLLASAHIVGGVVWVVAIGASFFLNDTFGKDLEFFEVD